MTDLTDNRIWRRILAQVHPDRGGTEEMFTFLMAVKEKLEEQEQMIVKVRGKGRDRVKTFDGPAVGQQFGPWWRHINRGG